MEKQKSGQPSVCTIYDLLITFTRPLTRLTGVYLSEEGRFVVVTTLRAREQAYPLARSGISSPVGMGMPSLSNLMPDAAATVSNIAAKSLSK